MLALFFEEMGRNPCDSVLLLGGSINKIDKHIDEIYSHLPHGRCAYIRKGSALKFFDLALGKADVYPRFAPTMEWDIAAGQAILEALGGSVIDINTNEPLTYNKESLFNPPFIAKTNVVD